MDSSAQVKVNGYYKKDGTYVQPHYRSNPDGNPYNNWSFPGNTNPYTGKTATGNVDTYLENYYKNNTGSNNNYSNYNYNSTTSYIKSNSPVKTGNLIVFTNISSGGKTYVYVDGNYEGFLNKYFKWGSPSIAGEDGTISLKVSVGYHTVQAIDDEGNYWEGETFVFDDNNNMLNLTK